MPKARVLAVDDQLYFRSFIEGLLAEEGYEVETAAGGEEALRALERERFDILLTDLVMPGMDGTELVTRVRELLPDQEIVVLSGVGDVKTAVGAMKGGATDYLLKPIDRVSLTRSLDTILQRRRLRDEHERLMAENLEFMGTLSLHERAVSLFATLAVEPLAERLVEQLCLETRAQGGVVWAARERGATGLRLAGARGLVQIDREPEELSLESLPPELSPLREPGVRSFTAPHPGTEGTGAPPCLHVPLRHGGELLGVARVCDKLGREAFSDRDRGVAEKLGELAGLALANALRFRALERRALRDPATRAYTLAYFEDVVRNEIQKASRFGRSFSVLKLELASLEPLRRRLAEPELARWLEAVVLRVVRSLRSTDLIAAESEPAYRVLLPETDALSAALLKRRVREALERSEVIAQLDPAERPRPLLAAASYPSDATQLESLDRVLEERIEAERAAAAALPGGETASFAAQVDALLRQARPEVTGRLDQVGRFLLDELERRPRDRGLLFLAPGAGLSETLREGLERLRGLQSRSEVVLFTDEAVEAGARAPITCVPARRAGTRAAFALYFGEGPAYALVRARGGRRGGVPMFHTSERALVERLAFQLQSELGIPLDA